MKSHPFSLLLLFLVLNSFTVLSQEIDSKIFSGLPFRSIGPAFTSGRISDIAINPENENVWYVAVGSGGVWKTENAGTTWKPLFDKQGSYSIGCLSIDPNNSHTIWVGTGENIGGRHVGFGDGIYVSHDDGTTWKNMGLKESEHISKIIIHPENSNIIWVAVQGPLWSKGGERGLYKSIDGGETWENKLSVNEWTGVTDLLLDPKNPDILYAATWQRHRTVASYLGGGPGSGIYKSTNAGETWEKLVIGMPKARMGKIGLALSPFDHETIYAAIELERRKGGFFISKNAGASWQKQSDIIAKGTGPHYYQEIYASPHQKGCIFFLSNYTMLSDNHGKSFYPMNVKNMHVDSHAVAFKKNDPNYILFGTDGGLYETLDHTKTWRHFNNLPITQYYKIAIDDALPFYNVYGGTQDNGSTKGPSQTTSIDGITNAHWSKILGADGHQPATEPGNQNIVYGEFQEGRLWRIDQITNEATLIQPQAKEGEAYERFNWDTPILVSPHNPARLYVASQRIWRSDSRGNQWIAISEDLTRNQERFSLPIMGNKQSWDNAWDVDAMSNYNTITSLSESPKKEGLLYAGTDDGIIQVTENGGKQWTKIVVGQIPHIPSTAFVNDIRADLFDENIVYAALDNHKSGDYKPYLIKSTNKGKNWELMNGDLPKKLLTWRLVQDHVDKNLLFLASEYGIYFTYNTGKNWVKLNDSLPTIPFRDISIHRRENDLVCASFGRGIYILDDITPLRQFINQKNKNKSILFDVKNAYKFQYQEGLYGAGDNTFKAKNPPYGAIFTYYLPNKIKEKADLRKEHEKKLEKEKKEIEFLGWALLEKEITENKPEILIQITDSNDNLINTITGSNKKGFNRVNWNLDYAPKTTIPVEKNKGNNNSNGINVDPGQYKVQVFKKVGGQISALTEKKEFSVNQLFKGALEGVSKKEFITFRDDYFKFSENITSVIKEVEKTGKYIHAMELAAKRANRQDNTIFREVYIAKEKWLEIDKSLNGYQSKKEVGERNNPNPFAAFMIGRNALNTTYGPTEMHKTELQRAQKQLTKIESLLHDLKNDNILSIEHKLKELNAPRIEGQD